MTRPLRVIAVAIVAILLVPGVALAGWIQPGSGSASARATSAPAGSTPTVSVLGRSVTVSWTASTFPDGGAVSGYTIARFDASTGVAQTILSGCTGTITVLSCTENVVPAGTWKYAVTPRRARWIGAESPRSAAVTVVTPTFGFSSSATVTALPATLPGSLANYLPGETVTFHLGAPNGTTLTGSIAPSPVPADGSVATSVTLPTGTSDGVHTVYAVGSSGSTASASVTVDRSSPTISTAAIQKSAGGRGGKIKAGGTYYVYAQVADAPAGVDTVTANVGAATTGATAVAMAFGSWTLDGVAYDYRSAVQTANAVLTPGAKTFTVTATDAAGNAGTTGGFSVTVDNTAPAGTDVQTANVGGGTVGKAETGDTATFSFSEALEPISVLAGWYGAATSVTVRIVQAGGGDRLQLWNAGNTTQLPLGELNLGGNNYVQTTSTFTGSTMTMSGTTVVVTLGTLASGTVKTANNAGTMSWTPSATATDLAGNACAVALAGETGASDIEF
jgi:hypothetical protein